MSTSTQLIPEMDAARARVQAEAILANLGISAERALDLFYRQVIVHNGLPFVGGEAGKKNMLRMDILTRQELDAALEKGYAQMREGRARPAEDVFAELRRDLAL